MGFEFLNIVSMFFDVSEEVDDMPEDISSELPEHIPVMLDEVLTQLQPKAGDIWVDGTLGLGGHSKEIIQRLGSNGRLISIDRDSGSIEKAKSNLEPWLNQITFVHDDYRNIDQILSRLKIESVDGILLDLGISSYQLNNPQRGFSIRFDGPLDMRMDPQAHISAYDLVNSLSEREISNILRDYGQERWHQRIARNLVAERMKNPISTTQELSRVVMRSIPRQREWTRIHPATRTFQAFRIAVNRELESVEIAVEKCVRALKPTARLGIIAFHSLEDKIIKGKFKKLSQSGLVKIITKKPLRPTEIEVEKNSRSRSARFRVAERV